LCTGFVKPCACSGFFFNKIAPAPLNCFDHSQRCYIASARVFHTQWRSFTEHTREWVHIIELYTLINNIKIIIIIILKKISKLLFNQSTLSSKHL
jgi:hypothetical protein